MDRFTRYLLLIALVTPLATSAQYFEPEGTANTKKWHPAHINFGIGAVTDRYPAMSLSHLMAFAENPATIQRDLSAFSEEATTTTTGIALFGSLGIAPLNRRTGEYRSSQELQLGFQLSSPKEAMVSYKSEDLDSSIVYCNLHGEFALEGAYVFKGQWGRRDKWNWYIGGGINAGITFGNQMILISGQYFEPGEHPSAQPAEAYNMESFAAKQVYYTRAYIPYGIKYGIGRKWQVGFDMRTGIGGQFIQGEQANYIAKTSAFIIGAKCSF